MGEGRSPVEMRAVSRALRTAPKLLLQWGLETLAFVLAPLIVYVVAYVAFGEPLSKLLGLREWLLVAILLFGEDIRRYMVYYRRRKGFAERVKRHIALGLLGIVTASILLSFSFVPDYTTIKLPLIFNSLQIGLVLCALGFSAVNSVRIEMMRKEHVLRKPMVLPEDDLGREGELADYDVSEYAEIALQ
jgi:hypothetical protein